MPKHSNVTQMHGDKSKALESVLAQIEKQHGKGSVMRLGDDIRPPIAVIPTGSIALDVALGIGGLPRGRAWRRPCCPCCGAAWRSASLFRPC